MLVDYFDRIVEMSVKLSYQRFNGLDFASVAEIPWLITSLNSSRRKRTMLNYYLSKKNGKEKSTKPNFYLYCKQNRFLKLTSKKCYINHKESIK
jgi:hypothetical protein